MKCKKCNTVLKEQNYEIGLCDKCQGLVKSHDINPRIFKILGLSCMIVGILLFVFCGELALLAKNEDILAGHGGIFLFFIGAFAFLYGIFKGLEIYFRY